MKLTELIQTILFPAFCLCCKKEGSYLCEKCFEHLERKTHIEVYENGSLDRLIAVARYEEHGLLARLIHHFKYEYAEDLAGPFGRLLAEGLMQAEDSKQLTFNGKELLCPVPLHPKRERWRGFNQAQLLANNVGALTGLHVGSLLKRTHFKTPQMKLSRAERLHNVEEAFVVNEKFFNEIDRDVSMSQTIPQTVILVDDVATTLSTLNACARELKKVGISHVIGLVIAQVD